MRIYLRKIFKHDTTHEISVKTNIVTDFFDNSEEFTVEGINSKFKGKVTINNATDPRFGGEIKRVINSEGDVDIDDIVVFYKYTYIILI